MALTPGAEAPCRGRPARNGGAGFAGIDGGTEPGPKIRQSEVFECVCVLAEVGEVAAVAGNSGWGTPHDQVKVFGKIGDGLL